jgi:hypothetical protein
VRLTNVFRTVGGSGPRHRCATLITLIFTFGPISGGHFNPEVTLADASPGGISQQPAGDFGIKDALAGGRGGSERLFTEYRFAGCDRRQDEFFMVEPMEVTMTASTSAAAMLQPNKYSMLS